MLNIMRMSCLSIPQDYQDEVTVVQENKHELQQLGERLARASHESKASDIEHKLSKVNERWQHLLDLIGARYWNTPQCGWHYQH